MAINIFWVDGFDEVENNVKYTGTYEISSAQNSYSSKYDVTPPFGYGRFCAINSGYLSKTPPGGSYDTVFSAFHMRVGRTFGSTEMSVYFDTWADVGSVSPCRIKLKLNKSTGNLDFILVVGTTEVNTWHTPVRFGQWHHVSLMFYVQPVQGKVRLAVDGQELVPYTGATAPNSSHISFNRFRLRSDNLLDFSFYVDDWVVATGLPTDPLLPPARVYGALMPNANVDVNWNPYTGTNWQCVDEIPNNGDSDYNTNGPSGSLDVFSHATIPNLGTDVLAVKVNCISRKTGTSTESIQPLLRVSGTDYYDTAQAQTTSYFSYGHIWQNNPATGLPWTPADAQSAGFGYRRP